MEMASGLNTATARKLARCLPAIAPAQVSGVRPCHAVQDNNILFRVYDTVDYFQGVK
jgi:hypothetical protein